jgi:hypothetical protein
VSYILKTKDYPHSTLLSHKEVDMDTITSYNKKNDNKFYIYFAQIEFIKKNSRTPIVWCYSSVEQRNLVYDKLLNKMGEYFGAEDEE